MAPIPKVAGTPLSGSPAFHSKPVTNLSPWSWNTGNPSNNKNIAIKLKIISAVNPPLVTTNLNTLSENLGTVVTSRFSGMTPVYSVAGVLAMGKSC